MSGVISQCDGLTILVSQATHRRENKILIMVKVIGRPTHTGVLRKSKQVAGRAIQEHFFGQWQLTYRSFRFSGNVEKAHGASLT
jgi:hypothetical protein